MWLSKCRAKGISGCTAECNSGPDPLCPAAVLWPYLENLTGNFSLKTRLSVWNGLSLERHHSWFPAFWKQTLQKNKIGENALFYCFGQSFLFPVSFFIGNKEGCFRWHFLRWKTFLWKIIGVFQLPPYESPINSNPAAGAINPYFCSLAKLYWNQWSRAQLAARIVIRSVAN